MSVFTSVSAGQLSVWLERYTIGRLVGFEGISAGVQNSNFFVTTTLGQYVLTLFEAIPRSELPFYLYLTAHLARHGLPVPAPVANRDHEYFSTLNGRPAALVRCLSGASILRPSRNHCARIGTMLAGLHLAGLSYGRRQTHPRGQAWCVATAQQVAAFLNARDRELLNDEIAYQLTHNFSLLPQGVIHADLFRDNVLWNDERIGGVIDFYFAGRDALLFDVAVTVNDWCSDDEGRLEPERTEALLAAYHLERPFSTGEGRCWQAMLRAAALRFWLSRAHDKYLPMSGEMVLVKEPDEYRDLLLQRIADVFPLPHP